MAGFWSSLLLVSGKCAGSSRRINNIGPELVFRAAHQKCAHKPNEISALCAELVFRDIPGQLVQRRGQTQRFPLRFLLRCALIHAVGDGVTRIPPPPTGLCFLPAARLAIRFLAGMLAVSYSRVRPKPPAAYRTRSLPGLWHGELLSSPPARAEGWVQSVQNRWVSFGEQTWVTSRERRRFVWRREEMVSCLTA